MNKIEDLKNVKQAAQFLGVSVATIWRKIDEIGHYKIGHRVLLSTEKHLLPYLSRCEKKSNYQTT